MAGNTSVILVRVLGNTRGLTRSLARAQSSLGGLDRISGSITSAFKGASLAAAGFSAVAIGGAAAGAAALAAMPLALIGLGIAAAAQSSKVEKAFLGLADHVGRVMLRLGKPLIGPLVEGAGQLRKAFDAIAPSLGRIFKASAPLLNDAFKGIAVLAKQIGPLLENAFKAGVPVLRAFGRGMTDVVKGIDGFFKELGKASPEFAKFATALMKGLGQLLPAFGRLLAALAPIGTAILSVLIPALVSLLDWISAKVGPAFQKVSQFFAEHQTAAKAVGLALIGLVVTVKAVQLAMAVASAATLAFTGVAKVVRAAIIVWKNAQLLLNLALMANPIGLVIAAIVALVAVFVIAYKKSETFRNIVNKSWQAIKVATVAVWNFLKNLTTTVWNAIKSVISSQVNAVKTVVTKVWNAIKSASSAVWNAIKAVVQAAINAVKSVVTNQVNATKAVLQAAWNAAKSATNNIWDGIKNAVRSAVNALMDVVRSIKGKILGAFSGAGSWLVGIGHSIISGLIGGIKAMASSVASAAKGVVQGAINAAKSALKIGSPSKVFRQFGKWTGEGLVIGMKDMGGAAARASADLSRKVADGFAAPKLTLDARPAMAGAAGSGNTYQITVQAPVGSSPAEIGRTIVKYVDEFERSGGRRRS